MLKVKKHFYVYWNGEWNKIPETETQEDGFIYRWKGAVYQVEFHKNKLKEEETEYRMSFQSPFLTKMKLELELLEEENYYHLIPCNIYGDNNAKEAKPGEFPLLTPDYPQVPFCSPVWEFRADRAAMPVSALCCDGGAAGISVEPYAEISENAETESRSVSHWGHNPYIHNGLFAELPNRFGVTLGYTNWPVTVKNRSTPQLSKGESAFQADTWGTVYLCNGNGRSEIHRIIRAEYEKRHVRAKFQKTYREAAKAMFDAFVGISWDKEEREYTNKSCRIPDNAVLRPWRTVPEIGWTGGGVLAYPLILCRHMLSGVTEETFGDALHGEGIIERIIDSYNESSGLFYDLTRPAADGSRVNGWWTGYGLVKDCHCAYNTGSALHYILKTVVWLKTRGLSYPERWMDMGKKVMDQVIALQREDGAFGYTYSIQEPEVLDWEGFAGCWFAPCAAYCYHLTGEERYLRAAKKALSYYGTMVMALNCWGTPMDTWKSVDQEGNLAFVRGCRLVYEYTKDREILKLFCHGAEYEYLWRYGYPTKPEYSPLKDGWNACGGSVTSISNPHIHPMGVIIDDDLRYLSEVTGDSYHMSRAEDSTAWLMQTLELYPEKTGYGCYGILSERWCPSDGLTTERYSDGRPYSSWFSYNLWAAANALEAVCEKIISQV